MMSSVRLTPRQKRFFLATAVFGALIAVVVWRLRTLPGGLSESEFILITEMRRVGWLSASVLERGLYLLPVKVLLSLNLGDHTILVLRTFNVFCAFAGLTLYYRLARNWWPQTVALACTVLLATSAWFLVTVRVVDSTILAMTWLPLLLLIFLKLKHESKWWQIATAGAVSGLAFYVSPIMAWLSLVLITTAVHYSMRLNRGRLVNGWLIFFGGFFVSLTPIVLAVVREPAVALRILGLAELNTPTEMLERGRALVEAMILNASHTPFVQNLPLLDIATITLALYGLLRALTTARLGRSTPVLFVLIVSLLITVLTHSTTGLYAYLLPIIYLLVARGLNQLMSEWYKRFPRNPSARLAGAVSLVLLVGLTSLYNIRVFYVAWDRSPAVRQYYSNQLQE
jgi:hypothetical protein